MVKTSLGSLITLSLMLVCWCIHTTAFFGQRGTSPRGQWREGSEAVLLRASGGDCGDCGKAFEDMTQEEIDALPDLMMKEGVQTIDEVMMENNRFSFKMRALRGEFSNAEKDDEEGTSLAETLMAFPGIVELKIVAKKEGGVVDDLLATINNFQGVNAMAYRCEDKMGGKFVSIAVDAHVDTALARQNVCKALKSDPRVKMAF